MADRVARASLGKHVEAKEIIAMKKYTPLEHVDEVEIKKNPIIKAKARHLYWACFRGHIPLIKHILENDKISPFASIIEGRSPMMAALIGKHRPMKVSSLRRAVITIFELLIFSMYYS